MDLKTCRDPTTYRVQGWGERRLVSFELPSAGPPRTSNLAVVPSSTTAKRRRCGPPTCCGGVETSLRSGLCGWSFTRGSDASEGSGNGASPHHPGRGGKVTF